MTTRSLIYIIVFFPSMVFAQDIRLLSATRQDWSGGVEGLSGTIFRIEVRSVKGRAGALPDTLWIGKKCHPLTVTDGYINNEFNTRRVQSDKMTVWHIIIQESGDWQWPGKARPERDLLKTSAPGSIPDYHGEALLQYSYHKRERFLVIKHFKVLPSQAYP